MNPKVKALVWTSGLLVISLGCTWVAWNAGSDQSGFLAIFLKFIAAIFGLTALGALVALVNFSLTSKEVLSQPKPKKKQTASTKAASRSSHAPAEFSFGDTELAPPAEVTKQPRPAPKKAPRPANKPSRPIGPPE